MKYKNTDKFLNMLYGTDRENYGMNKRDIKIILNHHIKSLQAIYEHLEDLDILGLEQFDLGDIINLVEEVRNKIEFESEEN